MTGCVVGLLSGPGEELSSGCCHKIGRAGEAGDVRRDGGITAAQKVVLVGSCCCFGDAGGQQGSAMQCRDICGRSWALWVFSGSMQAMRA